MNELDIIQEALRKWLNNPPLEKFKRFKGKRKKPFSKGRWQIGVFRLRQIDVYIKLPPPIRKIQVDMKFEETE